MNIFHTPVLTNEVLHFLKIQKGGVYIDCTLGTGGHTAALLEAINNAVTIYGIDADERNLRLAKERLEHHRNLRFIHDNFEHLDTIGETVLQKEGRIDGILFDLGLSSLHIEDSSRGFSFQHEGPLDMRFDTGQKLTAAEILNKYSLEDLIHIFRTYGNEKFSYRIATQILRTRKLQRLQTTSDLANLVRACVPKTRIYYKRHPATRVFQALRIATNREVEVLEKGLQGAVRVLSTGGRLVVISYHSLEDRIVKFFFKQSKIQGIIALLTKKPVRPKPEEVAANRRSRSACLRAAEKI